jgi:translation initiation factor IF-3
VRVIGAEGEQLGIMPTIQALDIARAQGLDLVEVAPNARPPVAKMLDYGRFKYEQSKREREGRRRQKGASLHQIKMRPNIGKHDMEAKGRTAARLLRNGDKVKISIMFRGREITHREIGRERIQEMLETLERNEVPTVIEKPISTEGRFMSVIVAEDKVKAKAMANAKAASATEAIEAAG